MVKNSATPRRHVTITIPVEVYDRWKGSSRKARLSLSSWLVRRIEGLPKKMRWGEAPELVTGRVAMRAVLLQAAAVKLTYAQLERASTLSDEDLSTLIEWLLITPARLKLGNTPRPGEGHPSIRP